MTEGGTMEIVGRFETRESFVAAVNELLEAGFDRADLSVLDTHETLEASETESGSWQSTLSGLIGEINYIGPISAAGLIAVAAGPVGAAVAAGVAAGLTGMALSELLENIKATPHTKDFAKALELGAVLLWVRVSNEAQETQVAAVLGRHGAHDVHQHQR